MPSQIPVTVVFSATGQLSLQQGAANLNAFGRQIYQISSQMGNLGRVARAVQADVNRLGAAMRSTLGGSLNFANTMFERMYSIMGRVTRYGFYTLIAQVGALSYAFTKLAKEFIAVNERFGELEIVLKSVYGSVRAARQLRDEIAKITISSPLPFRDIATTVRAYAAIPALSSQVGRQIQAGSLGDQQGFFRRAIKLTEQLTTFRPDKLAEDAVFAIREAVTGELRSLVRRFEFPISLLVQASGGKDIAELKRRPLEMFNAIKKAMDNIISPEAIREIAKQPKTLFTNIIEQIVQIPLLKVGRYGEDAGKSFYDKFLTFFYNVLQQAGNFINTRFDPIAKSMSASITTLFDSLISTYNRVSEQILNILHLGTTDLPGRGQLERIFIGITKGLEAVAFRLPVVVNTIERAVKKLVPIFESAAELFTKLAKFIGAAFESGPIAGLAAILAVQSLPSILRSATSGALGRGIAGAQAARTAVLSGFVNPNPLAPVTGAGAAAAARGVPVGRQVTVIPMPGGQMAIMGNPAQVNAWAGNPAYTVPRNVATPTSPAAIFGARGPGGGLLYPGSIAPRPTFNVGPVPGPGMPGFIGPVVGPAPFSLQGSYAQMYQQSRTAGVGRITSAIAAGSGALVGGGILAAGGSAGLSTGAASLAASGVGFIGAIVGPVLIAAAASAAIYLLVNKVSAIVEERRAKQGAQQVLEAGLTPENAARRLTRLQRAGVFGANVEQMRAGLDPAQQRALDAAGISTGVTFPVGIRDVKKEILSSNEAAGVVAAKILSLQSNFKVVTQTQNFTVDELIKKWSAYENDLAVLTKMMDQQDFPKKAMLESMPGLVIDSAAKADEANIAIRTAIVDFGKLFETLGNRIQTVTGKKPGFSLPLNLVEQQTFESANSLAENLESGGGLMDEILKHEKLPGGRLSGSISRLRKAVEIYKTNSIQSISGLTSESDRIITSLLEQQRPSYQYEHILKSEAERMDLLNNAFSQATRSLELLESRGGVKELGGVFQSLSATILTMQEQFDRNKDPATEAMLLRLKRIQAEIGAEMYGASAGPLNAQLRAELAAIGGSIHQGVAAMVQTVFTQLPAYFEGFAEKGPQETGLVIEAFRNLEPQLAKAVSMAGGDVAQVGPIFSNFIELIETLPSITGESGPEEVERIKAMRQRALTQAVQGLHDQMYDLANQIPVLFKDTFLEPIEHAAPVVKHFWDVLLGTFDRLTLEIQAIQQSRELTAFGGLFSGDVVPATGRGQQVRLQQQIGRTQAFLAREGVPVDSSYFSYTRLGRRYDIGDNLRTQRRYMEGQTALYGAAAGGYLSEAARLRSTGREEDILKAEQFTSKAEAILLVYDRLQAELQKRNRDMFATFTEGFLTVFDNFRERMQDFTEIGRTLANTITDGIGGAFADAALGVKSLSDAFKDFGQQLLATATKLFINKAVESIFGMLLGGGTGSILGQLFGGANRNQAAYYNKSGWASGGVIPGPPSSRDNRIAAVASGEYIIPSDVVRKLGTSHFEAYRAGGIPTLPVKISKFASGGAVGTPFVVGGGFSSGSNQVLTMNTPVVVNVEINDKGQVTSKEEAAKRSDLMARGLKIAIQEEILRQHRQGGIYKKQLVQK